MVFHPITQVNMSFGVGLDKIGSGKRANWIGGGLGLNAFRPKP